MMVGVGARSPSAALLLVVLASGCPGSMAQKDAGAGSDGDAARRADQRKAEGGMKVDLPTVPGAPCLAGACGPNLICMANQCLKMCTNPQESCNGKVAACGPQEACLYASSFSDACYPAPRTLGQSCDYSQAIFCAQGLLCVKVGSAAPTCLQLCQYGCPTGTTCRQTVSPVCNVCVPN